MKVFNSRASRVPRTTSQGMIKASRERKRIQKVIHALISPTKGSRKSLGSPAKARSGETPKAEPNVRRRMWTTPPPSLGTPPTPAEFTMDDEELVAQTPSTQQTSQHVPGLTPQLRAALPPDPLTQWSEEDVSACIKILGREFARDGTNSAHDVTTFDAYAETFLTKGIDGQRFANISIPQLMHDLGVSNYNHRLKIVSWIKSYLEVSGNPDNVFRHRNGTLLLPPSLFLVVVRRFRDTPRTLAALKVSGGALRSFRYMRFICIVAAMEYFVSAFLERGDVDAHYFDVVFPASPRPQDKMICPALALPDSPREGEEGEQRGCHWLVPIFQQPFKKRSRK